MVASFVFGAFVTLAHRPWTQPEGGDEAIWDYVAQCIVRGQAPYRDVVEIKSPLSAYMSAGAILLGRTAGLRDVIAIRLQNVLLMGLLSAFTFLVAAKYLNSLTAACIAVLVQLAPDHFADWMVTGTQPKLPMILFGLISILLVAKNKPFWAGFFSMLACLCWQPGLMFTGVAFLMFSRYLTQWRDLAAFRVVLGALVPLAVALLYFYFTGALEDLWTWTVVYNIRVYAPETAKSFSDTVDLLWRVSVRVFRFDLILLALGGFGLVLFAIETVRTRIRAAKVEAPGLLQEAIIILPLIYLGFCLVNFQSGPDLIPLFPFIGIFVGWLLSNAFRFRLSRQHRRVLAAVSMIVLMALIAFRSLTYRIQSELTLRSQEMTFAEISKAINPDDRIYVHGAVEILVLLNKPNLNPHVDLRKGKDEFIAQRTPGGFSTFIAQLEASAPKLVAISRAGRLKHREELVRWIEDHYDPMGLPGYEGVYLRRQETGNPITQQIPQGFGTKGGRSQFGALENPQTAVWVQFIGTNELHQFPSVRSEEIQTAFCRVS